MKIHSRFNWSFWIILFFLSVISAFIPLVMHKGASDLGKTSTYSVETITLSSTPLSPASDATSQMQQFASRLASKLNDGKQRGLRLEHAIQAGNTTLLIFKK